MSSFQRKINVIESPTPPSNRYDWWYDTNRGMLKRPVNGGYENIITPENGSSDPDTGSETAVIINLRTLAEEYTSWLSCAFAREYLEDQFKLDNPFMKETWPTLFKFWDHARRTWGASSPTEPLYVLISTDILSGALNYTDFSGMPIADFTVHEELWDNKLPTQLIKMTLMPGESNVTSDPTSTFELLYCGDIFLDNPGENKILSIGAGCFTMWPDGSTFEQIDADTWDNGIPPECDADSFNEYWKEDVYHKSIDLNLTNKPEISSNE